jgi:choice-of-anchor A domain-containing protein
MIGKMILFNVQADAAGYAAITNFANFSAPDGSNNHSFDPNFTANILWNVFDATHASLGGASSDEFIGSVIVATPNITLTMAVPGTSGRMLANGDVYHERDESEFHNYEFDPICPLPLPECCDSGRAGIDA